MPMLILPTPRIWTIARNDTARGVTSVLLKFKPNKQVKNMSLNEKAYTILKKTCMLVAVLLAAAMLMASCGSQAPDIESVRADFTALIDASREINDIFFGAGLPVYERSALGGTMSYDEASGTYYIYYDDPEAGMILKYYDSAEHVNKYLSVRTFDGAPEAGYVYSKGNDYYYPTEYTEPEGAAIYDENSPVYYDYVRDDCAYQSVDDIKAAAEKVYSREYLEDVYPAMFDGIAADGIGLVRARYMADVSGKTTFFLKSNEYTPLFSEQTKYDVSTMRVLRSSKRNRVTVEIEAEGRYLDYDTLEIKVAKKKKQLTFVRQNNEWRLDTPTY